LERESRQNNPNWTWEEEILAFATYIQYQTHGDSNHPAVQRLSDILRSLPIHDVATRTSSFRNRNSVARKLADIHTHKPGYSGKPTSGSRLDREIWLQFGSCTAEALRLADLIEREAEDVQTAVLNDAIDYMTFPEGRILYSAHKRRERSSTLRETKLQQFRRRHGRLFCEACLLDLLRVTGSDDLNVYECHHIRPLHEIGPTESRLDDLVVLCPTCHRIAHKVRPWPDLEQLRNIRNGATE
jgi:5-methylcytosine-specific restriction protein A